MSGVGRGIPASQLARDYGASLNEFSESISSLIDQSWPGQGREALSRRKEVCAAVSAAMISALDATTLTNEEREKLRPLMAEVMLPFWTKHCAQQDAGLAKVISDRAVYYLALKDPESQVRTAANMVSALLEAMKAPAQIRPGLQERLVPAFAHRMVGDTFRINEVRSKQGIEISLLATVCALLQISLACDPLLRALRLV